MSDKTIELVKNVLKPVMQRIFVKEINVDELKTGSGLYLPTRYKAGEKKHEVRERNRYIVIDIDPTSILYTQNGLRRGDEVVPFIPEGATNAEWPKVLDWSNGEEYLVFHDTEIGGIIKREE